MKLFLMKLLRVPNSSKANYVTKEGGKKRKTVYEAGTKTIIHISEINDIRKGKIGFLADF